jgi:hypothetical protein
VIPSASRDPGRRRTRTTYPRSCLQSSIRPTGPSATSDAGVVSRGRCRVPFWGVRSAGAGQAIKRRRILASRRGT